MDKTVDRAIKINADVSHQGILIFTSCRGKAEAIIDYYSRNYGYIDLVKSKNNMWINLLDGRRVKWVDPTEHIRGYQCSEAYIDREIDENILNTVVMPICIFCTRESIRMI